MTDLTPWEMRNGLWYKREDMYRNSYGVNGAKFRAARHLLVNAVVEHGIEHIVSAQSVLSPQAAITATLAEELGLECTIVVGASKPETAVKHESIRIAVATGAYLDTTPRVAYNGVIQPYAEKVARELGGWQMPYGITTPADAPREAVEAFLGVGGQQVVNMPPELRTLVIPFGSGNTAAGVLYGLAMQGSSLERVVLVGVGPDRMKWLENRLRFVDPNLWDAIPFQLDHMSLHGWFAEYGDRMPETLDDVVMHPTYEGKVVRFLNGAKPDWWTARDGRTGFWIVGGGF